MRRSGPESWQVIEGDCVEVIRGMEPATFDAIVTDPPYGLEFMGKEWDRLGDVGKTSHAGIPERDGSSVFGRTRVQYSGSSNRKCRSCCCWEWDYPERKCSCAAPDFPNVRAHQAVIMQDWHHAWAVEALRVLKPGGHLLAFGGTRTIHRLVCAIEDAGFEVRDMLCWLQGQGFPKSHNLPGGLGTALKPAWEGVCLARKPLIGTVAANVEKHGTGAISVDGCRIETDARPARTNDGVGSQDRVYGNGAGLGSGMATGSTNLGRWPANVILDEAAAAMLDEQTGALSSGDRKAGEYGRLGYQGWDEGPMPEINGDSGGASRFFYCAKASRSEREAGLGGERNPHPTVKPVSLMRWLVRLVTPAGGTVLDPFAGSGTTGVACAEEGVGCVLIEKEHEYADIARARVKKAHEQGVLF